MKLVIFGTGLYYENRKKYLKNDEVIALLDNSKEKQGSTVDGCVVCKPDDVSTFEYDYILLMSRLEFQHQMRAQLTELGIAKEKIITFDELNDLRKEKQSVLYYRPDCPGLYSTNKKVLLITHELSYTGAPLVVFDMAKVLKKNGYYPVITCAVDGELRSEIVEYGIPVYIEPNLCRKNKIVWSWVEQFDFIVLNTLETRNLLREFNNCGKDVIWWLHEADMSYQYVDNMELITNVADNIHIYAVGPMPYESYNKFTGNTNVKQLLYGVKDREEKIIFALIGMISYRKAQDVFCDAIAALSPEERKRAEFWIIGINSDAEIMEKIECSKRQMAEIKVFPPMPRAKLEEMSKGIDVLVCPSRSDPMPVVVTEFIRDKKACIVSDMIGTARYMEDGVNGLICKAEDVESLTEKMSWAISNPEELKKIGKRARELYEEKFAMNVFEANVMDIVNNDIMK